MLAIMHGRISSEWGVPVTHEKFKDKINDMDWYFSRESDDLIVPNGLETSDVLCEDDRSQPSNGWLQWGVTAPESFRSPNNRAIEPTSKFNLGMELVILKVFPNSMTMTAGHFAFGSVFVFLMWSGNLLKIPKISYSQLVAILPLAFVHTLGNLFTNMSLGKVAVSFTHTIKASEPFFFVLLSAMFLGEFPSLWVVSSLVQIVGGVALASLTEASFN